MMLLDRNTFFKSMYWMFINLEKVQITLNTTNRHITVD